MHIESGRHLYGGARQVRYLIDGLAALGVRNCLVCRPDSEIAAVAGGASVTPLAMGGDLDIGTIFRLEKVIGRTRPDIVHVHSRRGIDWFGGIAARRAGVASVLTRRVDSPEPHRWSQLKYRHYAALIAISKCVEAQLSSAAGTAPGRVARIPSAVDCRVYHPRRGARAALRQRFDIPDNRALLGVVAQLIPRKGQDALIIALAQITAAHPEALVLFFGRGPSSPALAAQIRSAGLADHARLVGFRDDLPELLPGLDLFVHPARQEGLGVAVLEAMACELPIVATRVGGLTDLIDSGRNGVLVAADEPDELAAAVVRLLDEPAAGRRLGRAARLDVADRFSVGCMARRHLDLYRKILSRHDHRQ